MSTKNKLLKEIRMFCSECMGGKRAILGVWPIENPALVEGCTAPECNFHKYRMGKDPDPPSQARVESGKKLAARAQQVKGQNDQN